MATLNILKPPKINTNGKGSGFWKQIGMIVIGTTFSLVLTILAAQLMESRQLSTSHLSSFTFHLPAAGVYIIRMKENSQKIVVR